MNDGKFYWLKLKKDFFKRHDVRILEGLPNGEQIVLFYLKLMLESIDHEGELRFSKELPYTPEMLSVITDTKPEVAELALKTLSDFGLVKTKKDGTILIPKVPEMVGSASDTDTARRSRRYRERKKAERDETSRGALQNVTDDVTNRHESKSKSKSKSKSIEIDNLFLNEKEFEEKQKFIPPTIEDVVFYCEGRHNRVNPQLFFDYYESRGWKKIQDWKAAVRTWEINDKGEEI